MFIGDVISAIDNDVIVFREDDVINCLICLNVILRLSLTTTEGTFLLFRVGVFVRDRLLLFLPLIIFYPLLSPRLIALHWFWYQQGTVISQCRLIVIAWQKTIDKRKNICLHHSNCQQHCQFHYITTLSLPTTISLSISVSLPTRRLEMELA